MNEACHDPLALKRRAFALLRNLLDLPDGEQTHAAADECGGGGVLASEVNARLAGAHAGLLGGTPDDITQHFAEMMWCRVHTRLREHRLARFKATTSVGVGKPFVRRRQRPDMRCKRAMSRFLT